MPQLTRKDWLFEQNDTAKEYKFSFWWMWHLFLDEIFCGFETVNSMIPDCPSSGSCGLPVVWQPPAVPYSSKTSGTWRDLAAWCKPSEQIPNHRGEREKKYGEIKRHSQMLHCRLMLIILVRGQTGKCSQIQMCGGSDSQGESPLDSTERNNSSAHERCRLLPCVRAKGSLWMSR